MGKTKNCCKCVKVQTCDQFLGSNRVFRRQVIDSDVKPAVATNDSKPEVTKDSEATKEPNVVFKKYVETLTQKLGKQVLVQKVVVERAVVGKEDITSKDDPVQVGQFVEVATRTITLPQSTFLPKPENNTVQSGSLVEWLEGKMVGYFGFSSVRDGKVACNYTGTVTVNGDGAYLRFSSSGADGDKEIITYPISNGTNKVSLDFEVDYKLAVNTIKASVGVPENGFVELADNIIFTATQTAPQ
jgi:hypothetical protein